MGERSAIAWCDSTWNPWQGCHRVSPGCDHCYMFREKLQYGQEPDVVVRSKPLTFNLPLRLKGPQRVFTCSWSDFFIHEADLWRDEAWAIIDRTRHLTYQILTKRVERVQARLPWGSDPPWPHVQIIVSVENQEQADRRIPRLMDVNAAVRGVSYEPALGAVDFAPWLGVRCLAADSFDAARNDPEDWGKRLDWIVIGGESGPSARPFDLAWARRALAQCRAAGVPVFCKQLGSFPIWDGCGLVAHNPPSPTETVVVDGREIFRLHLRDRKGGSPEEWPEDLRVREYPEGIVSL